MRRLLAPLLALMLAAPLAAADPIAELLATPKDRLEAFVGSHKTELDALQPSPEQQILARALDAAGKDQLAEARRMAETADDVYYCRHGKKVRPTVGLYVLGKSIIQRHPEQAEAIARELLKADAESYYGHLLLARVNVMRGKPDDAIPEIEAAIKKNPDSEDAFTLLGLIYLRANDLERARTAFQRVLQINPQNPLARDALKVLDEQSSVKLSGDKKALEHYYAAEKLFVQNKFKEAAEEYQKAISVDPKFEKGVALPGRLLLRPGRLRERAQALPEGDRA